MIKPFKSEAGKEQVLKSYEQLLSLWPVPYSEIDLPTQYGSTHVILAGDKDNPPLLLLHGVNDNSAIMWVYNVASLVKHFHVMAVDIIGGPNKSVPNENYVRNRFDQVVWLNEVAGRLNLASFYIAGVSYGGYLSFHYTLKEPQRVIRAVSMAGVIGTRPWKNIAIMLKMFLPEALLPTKNNVRRLMRKLAGSDENPFEREPVLFEHLYLMMKNSNRKAMFVHRLAKPNEDDIQRIKDKVHFYVGDHDFIEERKEAFAYMDRMGLRYKIIPHAGHGLNHEQPDAIDKEITDFLCG